MLALRNRVFLRLGVRNVGRRRARSALIVLGLMLGTAIIAAALATGDTMSRTIRASATSSLGQADERISVRGAEIDLAVESGSATGSLYFAQGHIALIEKAVARTGLVDGVAPAIIEPVAVQDTSSRQNEPRVTLFATDPDRMEGFGSIRTVDGREAPLGDLAPGEIYMNADAADELAAQPGDRVSVLAGATGTGARQGDRRLRRHGHRWPRRPHAARTRKSCSRAKDSSSMFSSRTGATKSPAPR